MTYWNPGTPWKGATVAVLASGPSMSQEVADSVKHLPRIAVCATYKLAPDADVIYAADTSFWADVEYREAVKCSGIKACIEQRPGMYPNVPKGVCWLRNGGKAGYDTRHGYLRTGGFSGYQALCLAVQMGAERIEMYGFDCHPGPRNDHHWHGKHKRSNGNPTPQTYKTWITRLKQLAPELELLGVEVVNRTPNSALTCFQ